MPKYYKYSVVLHNLQAGSKSQILQAIHKIPKFKREVSGEEEYCDAKGIALPDRPDRHLHIFIEFHNQRHFNSILKYFQTLSVKFQYPTQLVEGMWGRVQVDPMYGEMEQALDYLEGETKVKPTDANVSIHEPPAPGEYKCYKCNIEAHALNFRYTHSNQSGVCYRCWAIFNENPGEWKYDPHSQKMIFHQKCQIKELKEMAPIRIKSPPQI